VFDNLDKVAWKDDKTVTPKSSRGKEIVSFDEPVVLEGQVQIWPQKFLDCSSVTFRK
jgi:hypothetical protein